MWHYSRNFKIILRHLNHGSSEIGKLSTMLVALAEIFRVNAYVLRCLNKESLCRWVTINASTEKQYMAALIIIPLGIKIYRKEKLCNIELSVVHLVSCIAS